MVTGIPFEIRYEDSVCDPDDKEREELAGLTTGAQRTIQVSTSVNLSEELIESTLLHETLHAILYNTGISEVLSELSNEKLEEGLVIALENGLSQIYKRNY